MFNIFINGTGTKSRSVLLIFGNGTELGGCLNIKEDQDVIQQALDDLELGCSSTIRKQGHAC